MFFSCCGMSRMLCYYALITHFIMCIGRKRNAQGEEEGEVVMICEASKYNNACFNDLTKFSLV